MAKKNKRNDSYLSIRKKLIAAVAMLLVASFMVASSSYAWFTLSTAPEITGIQTSVGANGNLEMALWNGTDEPGSAVGDSLLADLEKNLTWGNLVNLQNEAYGLSAITLRPARLDVTGTTTTGTLLTPVYGADGRIEKLNNGSTEGVYVLSEKAFKAPTDDGTRDANGVYGIGNSTAMTQQQIDYRAGVATAASSINTAQTYAKNSLTAAGSEIASYAAQHATKEDPDNGPYDLTKLGTLIGLLKQSSQQLDNAMIAIATAIYAVENAASETYATPEYNADTAYTYLSGVADSILSSDIKSSLATFNTKREAVATAVAHAETNFAALGDAKTTATWAQFQSVVMDTANTGNEAPLVIVDDILINGHGIDTITSTDTINALVQDIMAGKGITASLPDDSGVYSDIAVITGNYTVKILLSGVSYNGLELDNTPASMTTDVSTVVNYKDGFPAAPVGTATDPVINDLYGYRIDMAFRTNATDSNLLLQTEGVGRIYSTGATNTTMGSGSTMSFETLAEGFDANDMKSLMKAIRLVFAKGGTSIVAVAAIDTTATDLDAGDALELPIKILDKDYYRFDDEYGFQFLKDDKATPATKAEIIATEATAEITPYTIKFAADNAITALTANQAETISVYVYLDGDYVENSDVAATAAQSMFGNLNLQFSSSASLVPMEYAPLQAGDNMGGGTQQPSEPSEP